MPKGGWESLGLQPELLKAIQRLDWMLPTDVQVEAIPLMLGGGDVCVAAETGSGKTGAFGLPIVQSVFESRRKDLRLQSESRGSKDKTRNYRFNPNDRSSICRISRDGLILESQGIRAWGGCRSFVGVVQGAHYYEVEILGGLGRVGWSTSAASYDLGTDSFGFGYGGTAKKSNKRRFESYGKTYKEGDVIGCYIDMSDRTLGFTHNGNDCGIAFKIPDHIRGALFPSVCMKNCGVRVRFQKPFRFQPPEKKYKALFDAKSSEITLSTTTSTKSKNNKKAPLALVIAPTKDLAEQIFKDLNSFAKFCTVPKLNLALVMGDAKLATKMMNSKGADIVVGTPQRVLDFVRRDQIDVSSIRLLVLDEADRLCDFEGMKTVNELFQRLPKLGLQGDDRLQVCFYSATLHSDEIRKLSEEICSFPSWVDLKGKDSVPETVHHVVLKIDPRSDKTWGQIEKGIKTDGVHAQDRSVGPKYSTLGVYSAILPETSHHTQDSNADTKESISEGLKRLKPVVLRNIVDKLKMSQCLIFCRTNLDCTNLEAFLTHCGGGRKFRANSLGGKENPYSCAVLAGGKSMKERRENLAAFKNGAVRFLICTDVAARGIDVKHLPYIVNMTLPDVVENYIHRIGRVGRAGSLGLAISIVGAKHCYEKVWYYDKRKWKGKKLST